MANQIISVDTNHDDATGRNAGEDFTITNGATLTIDSMPHLTPRGILGDITLTAGTLHIDGTRTYEVVYSNGSGTLPSIGASITWNSGSDEGKIVGFNSGNNVSGVLTLTKNVGAITPDAADSITNGSWSADLDFIKIGFLIVYGEDQDWGSVDAQSTLRITGDWYEVAIGDGTDSQSITLPHTGHQHAVWVETGNGTGIFYKWHRVASDGASAVYYNSISQFGATYESGFVFNQTFGNSTVTFGTSTAGGVPPSGARIFIPNVHMGTTTVGAPTTEINSATLGAHITVLANNTNLNVEIDHLNASSVRIDFIGTNQVSFKHSCFALALATSVINKVNASVYWEDVAMVNPSNSTGGLAIGALQNYVILDNVGGIEFKDCLVYGGTNATNNGALMLTTMSNMTFTGVNKIVQNQQDENTAGTIRGTVASNITAETIISLGGYIYAIAGCNNWKVDVLISGLPPGRGTTEQTIGFINLTGVQGFKIHSGNLASGAKFGTTSPFVMADVSDVLVTNFGEIDNKINGGVRATNLANISGISSNVILKRLWFRNMNTTQSIAVLNSCANITVENCSCDYNDELELDTNRTLVKGFHGGSGGLGSATGIEDDLVNVIGTCFYDVFTSDTAGMIGLVFNDKGNFHAADVTVTSGTPFFNGLGDLVMNTIGDQIVYEYPYTIKGHTGFANTTPGKIGVNPANIGAEYALDTGSGYGPWKNATGANLSAETISPSGFKLKVRLTANSGTSQNVRGFGIFTTTTIADQKANLYPLSSNTITLTGLKSNSEIRAFLGTNPATAIEIAGVENSGTSFTFDQTYAGQDGYIVILALEYQVLKIPITYQAQDVSIPIQQQVDRQYENN